MSLVLLRQDLQARDLMVPQEFPTIQSALDSVLAGDTVTVALGIYPEALEMRPVPILLRGETIADTGDYPRPVIDPSSLSNAPSRTCLYLPSGMTTTTVENFVFRNGPEMFPREEPLEGGVSLSTQSATFRHCIFDSTYCGIRCYVAADLTLEHCRFYTNSFSNIISSLSRIHATQCYFEGTGLSCGDSSEYVGCSFLSIAPGWVLNPRGYLRFMDCLVDNGDVENLSVIDAWNLSGEISGNSFTNLRSTWAVVTTARNCSEPLIIEHNYLHDVVPASQAASAMVQMGCAQGTGGGEIRIRDNIVESCAGFSAGKVVDIFSNSSVFFDDNTFIDIADPHSTIYVNSDSCRARSNAFINTRYALQSIHPCDARANYWGHESGPFHPVLNPNGLGDQVSDSVIFESWYPDTSFRVDVLERREVPKQFSLRVFPNPFNSMTQLEVETARPFPARLSIYNTLGQQVRDYLAGTVMEHREFIIDASALPAGIYFVKVSNAIDNSPKGLAKIALVK